MDSTLNFQLTNLVKAAVAGPPGVPDWSQILRILDLLESKPSSSSLFVEIFIRFLLKAHPSQKLNTLHLLDAIFKNSKKNSLAPFQSSQLIDVLNQEVISENPTLRNFIVQSSPLWVTACIQNKSLTPAFQSWQNDFCKTFYVPELNENLKKKFISDLYSAIEANLMFSQCLISAFIDQTGSKDPLLLDILPNIREIKQRAEKLLPTFVNAEIKRLLQQTLKFCNFSITRYTEFSKTGQVNQDLIGKEINEMSLLASSMLKNIEEVPPPDVDISVDEFFSIFHKIKDEKKSKISKNQTATEFNLLDLF